jgi:hypothetical protein
LVFHGAKVRLIGKKDSVNLCTSKPVSISEIQPMKILFVLFSTSLFFFSCLPSNNKQNTTWKEFSKKNYTIQYPSEWRLDTNKSEAEFILFAPIDIQTPLLNENINLEIQPKLNGEPSEPSDLDNYTTLSEKQIQGVGGTIFLSKRCKDSIGEYHLISYTAKINGTRFNFRQSVRMLNGSAFLLTYTGSPDGKDPYEKIVDRIFSSFHIK